MAYDEYGQSGSNYDEYGQYDQPGTIYDEYGQSVVEDSQYYEQDGDRRPTEKLSYYEADTQDEQTQFQYDNSFEYQLDSALADTQDEDPTQLHAEDEQSLSHASDDNALPSTGKRAAPSEAEAQTLVNAMKGRCLIPEPLLLPRMTSKGRNYTPPLGRSDVQRILGLSDFNWKNIRGLTRSLVRLHHLDLKDPDGKTIRWPEKNPKSKQTAQKKLEEQFPVLSRCQRSWASEYFLKTHTNNKIEAVPGPKQGSAAGQALAPVQSSAARLPAVPSTSRPTGTANRSVSNSLQQHSTVSGSQPLQQQPPVISRGSRTGSTPVLNSTVARATPDSQPTPVCLDIPAQRRVPVSQPTVSQSRSPSPIAAASTISESPSGTVYDDENADEPGPSQPAKRAKTARAPRGRPKGTKAPRAKKQTKAELEQAYKDLLRQNNELEMRASQANVQTSGEGSSASSRTVSPIASRQLQLPTPEQTPTHVHGKTLGTPRTRTQGVLTDPTGSSTADGMTRSGRPTFKTPAKRQAEAEQTRASQHQSDQADRTTAKQNQTMRRESLKAALHSHDREQQYLQSRLGFAAAAADADAADASFNAPGHEVEALQAVCAPAAADAASVMLTGRGESTTIAVVAADESADDTDEEL